MHSHREGRPSGQEVGAQQSRRTTSNSTPTSARTVEVLPEDDFYTLTISRRALIDAALGTLAVAGFLAFVVGGVVLGIAAGTAGVIVSLAAGVLAIMVVNAEQRRRGHER